MHSSQRFSFEPDLELAVELPRLPEPMAAVFVVASAETAKIETAPNGPVSNHESIWLGKIVLYSYINGNESSKFQLLSTTKEARSLARHSKAQQGTARHSEAQRGTARCK
jgi:hypothetical protein